ncbi:MAG: hypothetical protein JWQ43_1348 [Glaciihabitans sp.]|nr:hypothetical protein [Glaciihabitans sp.]
MNRHAAPLPQDEPLSARWASEIIGRVSAAVFAAIRVVRHPRPIHPGGTIFTGHVEWVNPGHRPSGVEWIDNPPISGRQAVTARLSRSVGLPSPLPDVIGLAFKFETERGVADLLLASSWLGLPGRFLLRPARSIDGVLGSLMPYRGDAGPVVLSARTHNRDNRSWDIDLFHATASSTWSRFAVVTLATDGLDDREDLRFDPIVNPLPGAATYDWTRRVRERSYRTARRSTTVSGGASPNP